mmetsp:Transcript_121839/g.356075  ORF Transcript_121839/g.356075 Transcript_121839/m.356075 type:complete len:238 (-) Transcript_121839:979-1692(-)
MGGGVASDLADGVGHGHVACIQCPRPINLEREDVALCASLADVRRGLAEGPQQSLAFALHDAAADEGLGRLPHNLCSRWIWMHGASEIGRLQPVLHAQRDLGDVVAGMGRYNCGSQYLPIWRNMQSCESLVNPIATVPVDVPHLTRECLKADSFSAKLVPGATNSGDLWVRVGRSRHQEMPGIQFLAQKCIPHGKPSLPFSCMGELVGARKAIASRIDVRIRRLQLCVHLYATGETE